MPTAVDFEAAADRFDRAADETEALVVGTAALAGPETLHGGHLAVVTEMVIDTAEATARQAARRLRDRAALCRRRAAVCRAHADALALHHAALTRWRRSFGEWEAIPEPERPAPPVRPSPPEPPPPWVDR